VKLREDSYTGYYWRTETALSPLRPRLFAKQGGNQPGGGQRGCLNGTTKRAGENKNGKTLEVSETKKERV